MGLDYLSLSRKGPTLSGGESQRIRLASQVGSELTGVLYILDEPSIGLHQRDNIKLLRIKDFSAYDIAVPVNEGIYQIGTAHVGLNKNHINQLIGKLRTTFVGFVSVVTIIFFMVSHYLAKYITRPISELTQISDEISRGNFDIRPDLGGRSNVGKFRAARKPNVPATTTPRFPAGMWTAPIAGKMSRAHSRKKWPTATNARFTKRASGMRSGSWPIPSST